MKHRIAYFGSALIVAGALTVGLASENAEKFDPAMEEMMKKAEAACTPGARASVARASGWRVEC